MTNILQVGKAVQLIRHFDQAISKVARSTDLRTPMFEEWLVLILGQDLPLPRHGQGAALVDEVAHEVAHEEAHEDALLDEAAPLIPAVLAEERVEVEGKDLEAEESRDFARSLLFPKSPTEQHARTAFGQPYSLLTLHKEDTAINTSVSQPPPSQPVELAIERLASSAIPVDINLARFLSLLLQNQHHDLSQTLYKIFFEECQLRQTLEWLRLVYFMEFGTASNDFAAVVFEAVYEGTVTVDSFFLNVCFQELLKALGPSFSRLCCSVALRGQSLDVLVRTFFSPLFFFFLLSPFSFFSFSRRALETPSFAITRGKR